MQPHWTFHFGRRQGSARKSAPAQEPLCAVYGETCSECSTVFGRPCFHGLLAVKGIGVADGDLQSKVLEEKVAGNAATLCPSVDVVDHGFPDVC